MASAVPATSARPLGPSLSIINRRDGPQRSGNRSLRRRRGSVEALELKQTHAELSDTIQMRSAQQFRVGNVTSNGRLQLRRVTRDAQSFQSPPTSPLPDVSTIDSTATVDSQGEWRESVLSGSVTSKTASQSQPRLVSDDRYHQRNTDQKTLGPAPPQPPSKQSRPRSHSFSTTNDRTSGEHAAENGIKIVVEKPLPKRASTSVERSHQLLEVSIPHYRLGTPYFSGKGSAILHSSINTGSTNSAGFRSSSLSNNDLDRMFPYPPRSRHWSHGNSKQYYPSIDATSQKRRTTSSNTDADPLRIGQATSPDSTALVELEAPPSNHNSRSLVRLSRVTGQIIAATPSGLIAQITSPNLLDYELLSDFFLTFRSYLTTHQLVSFLLARLRWAINRSDDFGRIVRVRTFVALRHWILNYFVDDFVSDRDLRIEFCDRVNELCLQLQSRYDGGGGDLNILGELKRCWRRTCALHWHVSEHKSDTAIDDILPGNDMETTDSSANGDTPTAAGARSVKDDLHTHLDQQEPPQTTYTPQQTSKHMRGARADPQHRMSEMSWHVESCSIPFKVGSGSTHKIDNTDTPAPQIARPWPSTSPSSIHGKNNAMQNHSRTASFSDALRDNRTALPHELARRQEIRVSVTRPAFAGSLVRGLVVRPSPPFVESISPESPVEEKKMFDFSGADREDFDYSEDKPSPSNQGMKKLLGSVKRALSTKQADHPYSVPERRSPGLRPSPRNSAAPPSRSSLYTAHGTPKRHIVGGRAAPRVDILALILMEKFQQEEGGEFGTATNASLATRSYVRSSGAIPDQTDLRIQSNVTMGSRSIVIVDDTGDRPPVPQHPMTEVSKPKAKMNSVDPKDLSDNEYRQTIPIAMDAHYPMVKAENTNMHEGIEDPIETTQNNSEGLVVSQTQGSPDLATLDHDAEANIEPPDLPSTHMSIDTATPSESAYPRTPEPLITGNEDPLTDRQPQLRRRPGGDLRAVDHVHSLEEGYNRQSGRSSESENVQETPIIAEATVQSYTEISSPVPQRIKPISVLPTHSSQPILRPSFENEVAKLAQLPDYDNTQDDGGIESTLRKLEGKAVEAKQMEAPLMDHDESETNPQVDRKVNSAPDTQHRRHKEGIAKLFDQNAQDEQAVVTRKLGLSSTAPVEGSVADSESSIPLLERGVSHPPPRKRQSSSDWLAVSIPPPPPPKNQPPNNDPSFPPKTAMSQTKPLEPSSLHQVTDAPDLVYASKPTKSFLLDDNQSLDGAEAKTSEPMEGSTAKSEHTHSFYFDENASVTHENDHLLPHPLRHPATPPKSKDWPLTTLPKFVAPGPSLAGYISQQDRDAFSSKSISTKARQSRTGLESEEPPSPMVMTTMNTGSHLPFILAYDSMLLAQQFTLIEKDALSEVDWRQLIDLRWNTHAKTFLTWVEYLKQWENVSKNKQLAGGVDLCISRFNMVVKWAISEIVLCQDASERVACIVKYIHLAKNARQLRNWATMFQITMALVGTDISRLKSTWQKVPEKEREYLKTLEKLITPTRNFHNLREEIDMAVAGIPAPGTDGGCIPFIGIYTHDLIYNAQKPAFAEGSTDYETDEPLINFERHRTAANIVKNLLRLVDASSKYPFQPMPEVLPRCLWLSALGDEEITALSKRLDS